MKELIEIQNKLKAPFNIDDIEWRIQSAGEKNGKPWARVLAYITARAVMDRLDNVFGIDGWKDSYRLQNDGATVCTLSVKINDQWISKEDASDSSDIEPIKGGFSGALKRAAVKFGVGRYLYHLTDNFAIISDSGRYYQPANSKKGTKAFKWDPPTLPEWAVPKEIIDIEKITILEEYLESYKEQGNKEAVKYINEILSNPTKERVDHAIYTIEQKRSAK
jgi:hypothetical protein